MNKNSVVAFLLIALAVIFFNSSLWNNFWYGKVLKKPVPTLQTSKQRAAQAAPQEAGGAEVKIIPPDSKPAAVAANGADSAAAEADTAAVVQIAEDTLTVETNRLIAAISTRGGRIISLKMKDYKYAKSTRKEGFVDLLPAGGAGGAQLSINDEPFDNVFFTVVKADTGSAAAPKSVVLEAKSAAGRPVQKEFSFADDTYKIGYTIRGAAVAVDSRKVKVGWGGGIEDSEASQDVPFGGAIDKRRAHYSDGRGVNHFEMSKRGKEEPSGSFRWVGVSSKYFFVALVADTLRDADIVIEGRNAAKSSQGSSNGKDKNQEIDYSIYYQAAAETDEVNNWIYAGPGRIGELSRHGLKFEKTLFPVLSWARYIFWADLWFPPIAEIILRLLIYFHKLLKDYGVAIILLTLLSKVVTYPLTQSSNRSMMRMRDLQPKIAALRQKYGKGNPQKFNEEMMALYKAEGINPLNPGCLPMFLQMPIFIALFVVLRKAVELRAAHTYLIPWVSDLSQPEALFTLPFSIPLYGANVALMPILMAALTFFQQKQAIQDPNQKAMVYMMPIIMLVMFNGFPAGVVFYWTLSSALGLVQQKWLLPKPVAAPAAAVAGAAGHHKAPVKKAGPHPRRGGGGGGKRSSKRG